jgi:hypothetical protein
MPLQNASGARYFSNTVTCCVALLGIVIENEIVAVPSSLTFEELPA